MRRLKISSYPCRNHIYINFTLQRGSFTKNQLVELIHLFQKDKLITIIDTEMDMHIGELQLKNNNVKMDVQTMDKPITNIVAILDKSELISMLDYVFEFKLESFFIADIEEGIDEEELLHSVNFTASKIVQKGQASMSIHIIFPENEIDVSIKKSKETKQFIKDRFIQIFNK